MHTVEFYHDGVYRWCYLLSPRLNTLESEGKIKVIHRSYILQRDQQQMIERFGLLSLAKREILGHWRVCHQHIVVVQDLWSDADGPECCAD